MSNKKPMTKKELLAHLKLHLAVQQPDVEQCWLEGYEQSQLGIVEAANPYPSKSIEYRYWNDGWWAAAYGEAPLFTTKSEFFKPGARNPKEAHIARPTLAAARNNATTANAREWSQMIGLRMIELIIATIIAVAGYQLVEFAFV